MLENKLDIYRNSYTFMFSLQMQHAAGSGPYYIWDYIVVYEGI